MQQRVGSCGSRVARREASLPKHWRWQCVAAVVRAGLEQHWNVADDFEELGRRLGRVGGCEGGHGGRLHRVGRVARVETARDYEENVTVVLTSVSSSGGMHARGCQRMRRDVSRQVFMTATRNRLPRVSRACARAWWQGCVVSAGNAFEQGARQDERRGVAPPFEGRVRGHHLGGARA